MHVGFFLRQGPKRARVGKVTTLTSPKSCRCYSDVVVRIVKCRFSSQGRELPVRIRLFEVRLSVPCKTGFFIASGDEDAGQEQHETNELERGEAFFEE